MNNKRNEKYLKAFGENLRSIRKEKGMTMMQLAHEADVEYSQIAKIESGLINTTISTVQAIAEAMGIPVKEFFDFRFPKK